MKNKISFLLLLFSLLFARCHKDPKTPIPEQELITTLKLTLTDTSLPYPSQTFIFRDIDGDGGADPTIDSVIIAGGKTYNASLLLLDERNFPADTSTNEIKGLNTLHQFFYQSDPADLFTNFTYTDLDDNGKPLGNLFSFRTKSSSDSGKLIIILRHEPDKNASNVSANDITNAGGETDIEVHFPVRLY
ncbi:MAG: type 1 periplasmic binding fold superfamily protein [Bacteroidota bacterium]|nr:type 1 periplasmic binding fold superfamily protein [Bacteroidota bacterium]